MPERLTDPERALALSYATAARRDALRALWALDERFGAIVAGTSEPLIGAMRLLWWREALERPAGDAPDEPLLRAIDALVRPIGIEGEEIGAMAKGWDALLETPLGAEQIERFARERGGRLFALSAQVLGEESAWLAVEGEGWALVDLARRTGGASLAALALERARATLERQKSPRWPRGLRPLGALAVLARADARSAGALKRRGSPARVARMLWLRIGGK